MQYIFWSAIDPEVNKLHGSLEWNKSHISDINHNIRFVIIAYIYNFLELQPIFLKSIKFSQCQQTFRTILTAINSLFV